MHVSHEVRRFIRCGAHKAGLRGLFAPGDTLCQAVSSSSWTPHPLGSYITLCVPPLYGPHRAGTYWSWCASSFLFFFYHWQSTTTVRWILLCENKTKHLVVPLNEFGVFSSQVRRLTWEGSGLCNLNDREQQRYRSRTDRRKVAVLLGFLRQKGT